MGALPVPMGLLTIRCPKCGGGDTYISRVVNGVEEWCCERCGHRWEV